MSNRVLWHGVYPRAGWGMCDACKRVSQRLFYWNRLYAVDREAARGSNADWLCRRCIDSRPLS